MFLFAYTLYRIAEVITPSAMTVVILNSLQRNSEEYYDANLMHVYRALYAYLMQTYSTWRSKRGRLKPKIIAS